MMTELSTKPSGIIQPFSFDNVPIRGLVLRIHNLSDHIPSATHNKGFIEKALAEMLTASAILTYDLKNNAAVTLQIQSTGNIPLMVAQCDKSGGLRAYARVEDDVAPETLTYKDLSKEGSVFAVSVEQGEGEHKHVYQSLVGLNGISVSSSVEQYFNDSVQLNTYFKVVVGELDGKISCGCVFLQALPGKDANLDDWKRMDILLNTLTEAEILPGKISETDLLSRLFVEDDVRIYQSHDLHFASPRSRERMIKALKSLGEKQCLEILEEGPIVMTCEFTGTEETFTAEDIRNIFDTDAKKE